MSIEDMDMLPIEEEEQLTDEGSGVEEALQEPVEKIVGLTSYGGSELVIMKTEVAESEIMTIKNDTNDVEERLMFEESVEPQMLSPDHRGAGGRRKGRVRTRGGRSAARGRVQQASRVEAESLSVGFIDGDGSIRGLHRDVPLEKPLHVKRRRLYDPVGWASVSASTSWAPESGPDPSASTSEALSTPAQAPMLDEERPTTPQASCSTSAPSVPSPAAYAACGSASARRRALRDDDVPAYLNLGSEDDSDPDDDEDDHIYMPVCVPRTDRPFLEAEEEPVAPVPEAHPVYNLSSPSSSPRLSSQGEPLPSTSRTYEPSAATRFWFDWRNFPTPPVPSAERREDFIENCGPTAPYLSPYDAFVAIWDQNIMEYIAVETNRYAQQVAEGQLTSGSLGPTSRIVGWRDTDAAELYVYFALLLMMGMCIKGQQANYWAQKEMWATPKIGKYMTCNRFVLLSRCLHFADNRTNLQTMTRPEAKVFKIKPIVDHLNHKFSSLYRLNCNIAIDESLTQWKGWLSFKQYIKNKAASAGVKTYEVCESQTGYLWRFKVHAGRVDTEGPEREVTPVSGVIPTLVLELLQGLEYKGHTVWMDNYYNSPALARTLKSLGFDCVGTLRTNRQCVPTQLAALRKQDMAVGQISSSTSGDVDVILWRDQNRVAMISTYHGNGVHTRSDGKSKPIAIHDYNVCMGGVDKKDQMLSAYPIERKRTQVWYKKFFRRLLNVSVLNAYIMYKHNTRARKYTHREFRSTLIHEIVARHKPELLNPPVYASPSLVFSEQILAHFPEEYGFEPGRGLRKIRRSCVLCHKRVPTYCPACKVTLCAVDCTKRYHRNHSVVV